MPKYNYFVDNIQVNRSEFFKQLRQLSQTARRVDTIAGWCGVDIMEFDEEKYNGHVKDINSGFVVIVMSGKLSKSFRRKIA
jgi:hypothetical protein